MTLIEDEIEDIKAGRHRKGWFLEINITWLVRLFKRLFGEKV